MRGYKCDRCQEWKVFSLKELKITSPILNESDRYKNSSPDDNPTYDICGQCWGIIEKELTEFKSKAPMVK